MPIKGVAIIEERLNAMLGIAESTDFTCSLAEAFDGPFYYLPGENIWEVGEKPVSYTHLTLPTNREV